jgi:hypothetical protein
MMPIANTYNTTPHGKIIIIPHFNDHQYSTEEKTNLIDLG